MPSSPTRPLAERVTELLGQPRWRQRLEGIDVVCGPGRLAELGSLVAELGARRILLVTDPGVRAAGHVERALAALASSDVECHLFDRVEENPTGATIERGAEHASGLDIDILVALGGGSAMDAAKGINLILTNGGHIDQYEGFGRARRSLLPAIGIPTTAGTGSEAQSYALIAHRDSHRKMACGNPGLRFRLVVLDPELPSTAPPATKAASGLDAVSHALESFVTTRRTRESIDLAQTAWNLLDRYLEAVFDHAEDSTAPWRPLQLAAFLAGAAIERSMLGAAHACANPLTARFGVVHGIAVALMLPPVVRFNGSLEPDPYRELAATADGDAAERIAHRVGALRSAGDLPSRLGEIGVSRRDLADLVDEASRQWTLSFNPRPVSRDDLMKLYENAL